MTALDVLIKVGGDRVEEHAQLGALTTYRVGGRARCLVRVSSDSDLAELSPLMAATELPLFVLGNGSNVLVADGETPLVALRLGGQFASLRWHRGDGGVTVEAGAAIELPVAARRLAHDGVTGLEWAVGVPGTFGGAAKMNAGGHGSDVAATILSARVWRAGTEESWGKDRLALGYRTSALQSGDVVLGVTMALRAGAASECEERVRDVVRWRRENQPGGHNAGSVFRNPPNDSAARLIDLVGGKGLRVGSASVSEKHANFIQADSGGRASDVYQLISLLRDRVREASGVDLASEHHFVGFGDGQ